MTSQPAADFIKAPSPALFDALTKDQLLEVASHYGVAITLIQRKSKEVMKDTSPVPSPPAASGLTFERQKELLLIQQATEVEKRRLQEGELEKLRFQQDAEAGRQNLEKLRLELERQRLLVGYSPGGDPSAALPHRS